jgi:hypothetical protein
MDQEIREDLSIALSSDRRLIGPQKIQGVREERKS